MTSQDNRTEKRKTGDIGENIACNFLEKRGFVILDRNYLKKWGEIDIVAQKGNVIRFIEVKTVRIRDGELGEVTCGTKNSVSHGTYRPRTDESVRPTNHKDWFRPEDNVHPQKLRRLARTMQTYLLEKRIDGDWQLDIVTVKMDQKSRMARVEIIENIII